MITLNIGGEPYTVPTSWKDITYKKYCEVITFDGEAIDFISLLSNIPRATIESISPEEVSILSELFIFVQDQSLFELFNTIPSDLEAFDIGKKTWYSLEKCKQEIKKHENFICAAGQVIRIYTGQDISELPIYDVWGSIKFFVNQLNKFFEDYKRLSDYEEDEDEWMANVKRFERFGFFAQCVELSRKMGKSYDEVLNMPAKQIYETFLYDYEKSDYEKTLYRIKSNKKS